MSDIKQNSISMKDLVKIGQIEPNIIQDNFEKIPGLNEQKLLSERSIVEKVYCFATTSSGASGGYVTWNTFNTNSSIMSATNGQITIPKNGWYLIIASADLRPNASDANSAVAIELNGAEISEFFYENTFTPNIIVGNTQKMVQLNKGDVIKVKVDSLGAIGTATDRTFLQVREL